jgi:hypothetical protein
MTRYTQPQFGGLQIDPTYVPIWAVIGSNSDLINNTLPTKSGISRVVGQEGVATQLSASGGTTNYVQYKSGVTLNNPFSLVIRAIRVANGSANSDAIWNTNSTDTTNNSLSLKIVSGSNGVTPNTPFATLRNGAGTQFQAINLSTGPALSSIKYQTIIVNHDGSTLTVWLDGIQIASIAASGQYPGLMGQPIRLGTQGNESKCAPVNVTFGALLGRSLSITEITKISASPYQLILDEDISWLKASTGGTTYILSPGGTVTFTGTATYNRQKVYTLVPSGTVIFSGAAAFARNKVYTLTPSGTVNFSGTSPFSQGGILTPGGTITFFGSSLVLKTRAFTAEGNVQFSGGSSLIKTKTIIAGGFVVFTGTANIINPATVGTVTTYRTLTGMGL